MHAQANVRLILYVITNGRGRIGKKRVYYLLLQHLVALNLWTVLPGLT